jgi:sugar phosphate isomerase/epimerase
MNNHFSRRTFLQTAAVSASVAMLPGLASAKKTKGTEIALNKNPLKLGMMTFRLGMKWDIDTIIKNCTEAKFEHVELRTTHAHGVEVTLSAAERAAVRKRFADAGLAISLASGFRYNSPDPAVLKKNIEGTKEYTLLAKDVGALGIRVFGDNATDEKMMKQIGEALGEVGEFGYDNGVEIRVCDDGPTVGMIKKNIEASKSSHVYVNWNCPMSDLEGGFEANFNSVKHLIRNVHLRDLYNDYPWRLFFSLLSKSGYKGYLDAEIPGVEGDPIRFMKYYRALFLALQDAI